MDFLCAFMARRYSRMQSVDRSKVALYRGICAASMRKLACRCSALSAGSVVHRGVMCSRQTPASTAFSVQRCSCYIAQDQRRRGNRYSIPAPIRRGSPSQNPGGEKLLRITKPLSRAVQRVTPGSTNGLISFLPTILCAEGGRTPPVVGTGPQSQSG